MNLNTRNPLETLVVAQLAYIRRHEIELHHQFESPMSSNTTGVAAQLLELQQSADRLSRMIDAMGINNGQSYLASRTPAAA